VTVPGTATPPSLADLASLVDHLAGSAVESGLGAEPITVGAGRLTARLPLGERTRTPDGRLDRFALAAFADMGIGVAVNSAVVGSTGGPTVELSFTLAAQPAPHARFLLLESEAISVDSVSGVGRAVIRDDTGVTVAHVHGVMATSPGVADPTGVRATERFDPRWVVIEPQTEDHARAQVTLDRRMANNRGSIHGGVLTGIAMRIQDAFHPGPARQTLSFAVQFLRPAAPELGHLESRTEFVRRGRTFRTVRTRLLRPDGVVVAESTGTSAIGTETS
jgi:uncharacterized protein (TIGR00369 family)